LGEEKGPGWNQRQGDVVVGGKEKAKKAGILKGGGRGSLKPSGWERKEGAYPNLLAARSANNSSSGKRRGQEKRRENPGKNGATRLPCPAEE